MTWRGFSLRTRWIHQSWSRAAEAMSSPVTDSLGTSSSRGRAPFSAMPETTGGAPSSSFRDRDARVAFRTRGARGSGRSPGWHPPCNRCDAMRMILCALLLVAACNSDGVPPDPYSDGVPPDPCSEATRPTCREGRIAECWGKQWVCEGPGLDLAVPRLKEDGGACTLATVNGDCF